MDTLSLYYFSELAKDLHITRTANRLFISQQTLSNHIMRLEEYYGVKLLNRKPSLSLTSVSYTHLDVYKRQPKGRAKPCLSLDGSVTALHIS